MFEVETLDVKKRLILLNRIVPVEEDDDLLFVTVMVKVDPLCGIIPYNVSCRSALLLVPHWKDPYVFILLNVLVNPTS